MGTVTPVHIRARLHVARALRQYMADHGMKVRDFNVQILGVKPTAVIAYNWIAGRSVPVGENALIIARLLGKKPEWLLPRPPPKPRTPRVIAVPPAQAAGYAATLEALQEQDMPDATPASTLDLFAMGEEAMTQDARTAELVEELTETEPTRVAGSQAAPQPAPARVVSARAPRTIAAERARRGSTALVQAPMPSPEKVVDPGDNTLSFHGNGSGMATVRLVFTAPMSQAVRVFAAVSAVTVNPPQHRPHQHQDQPHQQGSDHA